MSVYYSRARSYSRSYNAVRAENKGHYPATRAAIIFGYKNAKALREVLSCSEWHHVGKYAREVDYYNVPAAERTFLVDSVDCFDLTHFGERVKTLRGAMTTQGRVTFSQRLPEYLHVFLENRLNPTPPCQRAHTRTHHQWCRIQAELWLTEHMPKRTSWADAMARQMERGSQVEVAYTTELRKQIERANRARSIRSEQRASKCTWKAEKEIQFKKHITLICGLADFSTLWWVFNIMDLEKAHRKNAIDALSPDALSIYNKISSRVRNLLGSTRTNIPAIRETVFNICGTPKSTTPP